jgi:hypothetical protein
MRPGHVFVVLTEYRPGNGLAAGRGLFAARAIPLPIDRDRFQPGALLVARPGQRGFQHFYSESGRPFCLYAVLCVGTPGHRARAAMVDRHVKGLSDVLASVRIAPAPG